jgi:hypothetical protein
MNKFAVGVVVGFILSCGLGLAAESLDHNGVFWNRLGDSAKKGYVDGYSDAMNVSVGKLDNLMVAADLFRWKGAKKIIHQLSRELSVADARPEDMVKGLNDLYADHKYSELDLGSAMQYLNVGGAPGTEGAAAHAAGGNPPAHSPVQAAANDAPAKAAPSAAPAAATGNNPATH